MARAEHAPAAEIEDGDQIEPALAGEDAGGIGDPDLVGAFYREAWKPIGSNGSAMAAVGGSVAILGTLPGKEVFGPHEPGDAIAPPGTTKHLG